MKSGTLIPSLSNRLQVSPCLGMCIVQAKMIHYEPSSKNQIVGKWLFVLIVFNVCNPYNQVSSFAILIFREIQPIVQSLGYTRIVLMGSLVIGNKLPMRRSFALKKRVRWVSRPFSHKNLTCLTDLRYGQKRA